MRSKYRAVKTAVNGIVFDSIKEARRYQELLLLEKDKKIRDLRIQVPYTLVASQKDDRGKVIERAVKYTADFVYYDIEENREVVEDTKGFKTKEYIIKRKLMLERYGIRIKEV